MAEVPEAIAHLKSQLPVTAFIPTSRTDIQPLQGCIFSFNHFSIHIKSLRDFLRKYPIALTPKGSNMNRKMNVTQLQP
jgi:hypothetical protein